MATTRRTRSRSLADRASYTRETPWSWPGGRAREATRARLDGPGVLRPGRSEAGERPDRHAGAELGGADAAVGEQVADAGAVAAERLEQLEHALVGAAGLA